MHEYLSAKTDIVNIRYCGRAQKNVYAMRLPWVKVGEAG
jgi:hypothetical protein